VGRAEERCKGAAREIATRWARLLLHCIPLMGHYPRMGAQDLILIKSNKDLVFPSRFFQGCLPKISCAMCLVYVFYASAKFSLSNLAVLLLNKVILFQNKCRVLGFR
jgi:hypothetical protein